MPLAFDRDGFRHFLAIPTRWMDNDLYGHVNNVTYYSYFDTVINRYLIEHGGLDIHQGAIIGLAVETSCTFTGAEKFPDALVAGQVAQQPREGRGRRDRLIARA